MDSGKLSLLCLAFSGATNVQLREDRTRRGRRHACLVIRGTTRFELRYHKLSDGGTIRAQRFLKKIDRLITCLLSAFSTTAASLHHEQNLVDSPYILG